MDRLIHRRFPMRHHNRLAAIATRFDHAAFVVMADLVADFVAEVHIYSPEMIPKAVKRGMHDGFHMVRKLLAALNVAIGSNLDQHQSTPLLYRLEPNTFRSFDAPALEKAFVRCVLLDVCALALLCRIDTSLLGTLRGRGFGMVARAFLAMVRRRNRRQVSMFRHCFLANCSQALDSLVNAVLHEKPEIERDHNRQKPGKLSDRQKESREQGNCASTSRGKLIRFVRIIFSTKPGRNRC